jgi:hypothetical protein
MRSRVPGWIPGPDSLWTGEQSIRHQREKEGREVDCCDAQPASERRKLGDRVLFVWRPGLAWPLLALTC